MIAVVVAVNENALVTEYDIVSFVAAQDVPRTAAEDNVNRFIPLDDINAHICIDKARIVVRCLDAHNRWQRCGELSRNNAHCKEIVVKLHLTLVADQYIFIGILVRYIRKAIVAPDRICKRTANDHVFVTTTGNGVVATNLRIRRAHEIKSRTRVVGADCVAVNQLTVVSDNHVRRVVASDRVTRCTAKDDIVGLVSFDQVRAASGI